MLKNNDLLKKMLKECDELVAIFVSTLKTLGDK
jgi:hypothetical protein